MFRKIIRLFILCALFILTIVGLMSAVLLAIFASDQTDLFIAFATSIASAFLGIFVMIKAEEIAAWG